MNGQPTVGLLPLYLKLYDDVHPELRADFEPFLDQIAAGLANENVATVRAPVCRLEAECWEAMELFDREDVDLIVTVHLAYSPSLESVTPLASTDRPLLLLDTTMDYRFGLDVDPGRIMFNHGIHGVQDLASMLRRRGKPFQIVAGHVTESDALKRAAAAARAAMAARALRGTWALRIGEPFRGMGDFAVDERVLRDALGILVEQVTPERLAEEIPNVSDEDIRAEMERDHALYAVEASPEVHRRSVRVGLALRRVLEGGNYTAFSMNFLAFDSADGPVDTVPFLEASKAMARGIGYAGEGDVLTAALVGALGRAFGNTTFTEIFCPDWEGGALFLSHMGEFNPAAAAERPRLCEKDFPWTGACNPAVLVAAPAPGAAVLVNLAPGPNDTFGLIVAPVEVLGDAIHASMRAGIRGWIRPRGSLETFLEQYSALGGTHHSALVLGDRTDAILAFAAYAGIVAHVI